MSPPRDLTVSVAIPDIPENLDSLSPSEISNALTKLVTAKLTLEQTLRKTSTAIAKCEGAAKKA